MAMKIGNRPDHGKRRFSIGCHDSALMAAAACAAFQP